MPSLPSNYLGLREKLRCEQLASLVPGYTGGNRTDGEFALEDDGHYFRFDPTYLSSKGLWLSSRLKALRKREIPQNGSWGRLVRFTDANGVPHQLILSMADFWGGMETVCGRRCWNRDFEFRRIRRLGALSFVF